MANGWTGNILRVNLTTGNITLEDSSKFKSFVGGMGFGYKIMYDEVPPGTKPFDEARTCGQYRPGSHADLWHRPVPPHASTRRGCGHCDRAVYRNADVLVLRGQG